MCGRFVSSTAPDQLASYFDATFLGEAVVEPRFNVAPTTAVPAVSERQGHRVIEPMRWGLVPPWAKDLKIGNRLINARSETAAAKSAFAKPLARRRCIIPADGFYEWTFLDGDDAKTPMFIHRVDAEPFAFAGLWERWHSREGGEVLSCAILTGAPNAQIAPIHERMPVMVDRRDWSLWLDPDMDDVALLKRIFAPVDDSAIVMHPVSKAVNNPRSTGRELIEAVS